MHDTPTLPKLTVIIDFFELYIDQAKNLNARNLTWSSYKHHHTAKYLIEITPKVQFLLFYKDGAVDRVTSI